MSPLRPVWCCGEVPVFDRLRNPLAGVGLGLLIVANRHVLCKRGWHLCRTWGNGRGFYLTCPLCGFSVEARR